MPATPDRNRDKILRQRAAAVATEDFVITHAPILRTQRAAAERHVTTDDSERLIRNSVTNKVGRNAAKITSAAARFGKGSDNFERAATLSGR